MIGIRKVLLTLSAFLLLSACGILLSDESVIVLKIGTNDYDPNNTKLMKRVQSFDPKKIGIERYLEDSLVLFETTGKNVMDFASQAPLTWVHFWRPWCPNDGCQDISMFDLGSRAHQDKGLFLILLSESYSLSQIDTIITLSDFRQPICVVDANTYGTSIKKNKRKFLQDLRPGEDSDQFADDFLYRRDSLIFSGRIANLHQLDSILKE